MTFWKKALIYGVLTWLVPFVTAFFFYSSDGTLSIDILFFKTIMILVGAVTGALALSCYFKELKTNFLKESVHLGLLWVGINWLLDLFILVPMAKMTLMSYFTEIGLRYFVLFIFTLTIGSILEKHFGKS